MIFYTRILEALILSWTGDNGQVKLTDEQEYTARTIKFGLVVVAFILSAYARIFREEVTKNFTAYGDKEKTNGTGVQEQLLSGTTQKAG